ncbi:hypothetical protein D3C83_70340 [compost metagenome]
MKDLNSQRATETSGAVVRFGPVVIHEDLVVTSIAKEGAAEFSDIGRRYYPARRFGIEISELL